jgi:hypothetical protein
MKTTKTPKISRRERRLAELQVREYNAKYHPELKDAIVELSPCGRFASVLKVPDQAQQRQTRGRRSS